MRIRKLAASAALGLAALGLSACATGLNTKVTRFTPATIPVGQSFYVMPAQGAATPQFYRFASMVTQQLQAKGFRPAGAPQVADMIVRLDYDVDEGRTEVARDPHFGPGYGYGAIGPYGYGGYRDPFYDPYWGVYYGRPYYSRWSRNPYYYGWNDPYWASPYSYGGYGRGYGGYGPYGAYGDGFGRGGYREYTVYKSRLDMNIVQRANNAPLFEGHAQARSQTDEIDVLVPNLIQAMFTGFPGRNGETVRITVPNRRS
jgi:hypothetical protein